MLSKRKLICLILSTLSFGSTDHMLASDNDFEETLRKIKQVCPALITSKFPQGIPLPTEEDFGLIESKFTNLPHQLKQFLKECGNRNFRRYDPASAYRTIDMSESNFLKLNHRFRGLANLPNFLAFCHDNGNYFCIDSTKGIVRYWQHEEKEFSREEADCWSSFHEWLEKELLPHQK